MHKIAVDGYLYSKPDSAFYFAQLQYDLAESVNKKKQMSTALNTQGASFYFKGDLAKAIDYYTKSLKIREELGNKIGIAMSLGNIGVIYEKQGNYANAIEYYARSLKIREETGDKKGIASTLNNIGNIYHRQGNYKKAMYYFSRSLKIREEIGNKKDIAQSLNNIGNIYDDQGDYAKALDYHTKSLKIKEEIVDKRGIAMSLNNIGAIYSDQGDYAKAIDYYTRSLKISVEIGSKNGIAYSLNNIGNIYYEQGDYDKALEKSTEALGIAQEIGVVKRIEHASNNLWKINKKLGKHRQALEMHELYIQMRDSILSIENKEAIIHQGFKYEYEKEQALADAKHNELMHIKSEQIKTKNEKIEKERVIKYSLFIGMFIVIASLFVIFKNLRKTRKQKRVIEQQKEVVELAHDELEEKNQEIIDSIIYAKRIQSAILPSIKVVKEYLKESFILYKPKDVVAGDFYWMEHRDNKVLFAAADCTGHGVPGAMVSVVCNNALNRSVREHGLTDPGEILSKTREIVVAEFEKSEEEVKDGMDIALCSLEGMKLQYAGAHNPLWIIRNGAIIETKANKQPVGKFYRTDSFTTHSFDLEAGDSIYIFSDGYVDQFGGEEGKKFKAKAFRELLRSIQDKPMEEQKTSIDEIFETWKSDLEQIDDVCVIGVRV
jgi:serine phosphatase RsbU (regulator of sigma subunit)